MRQNLVSIFRGIDAQCAKANGFLITVAVSLGIFLFVATMARVLAIAVDAVHTYTPT